MTDTTTAAPPVSDATSANQPGLADLANRTADAPDTNAAPNAAANQPPADGRPDWLPEKFWNAADAKTAASAEERTKLAAAAMSKSYSELETRQRAKPVGAPEKPDEYELVVPDTVKNVSFPADDPVVMGYREQAHKLGLSKEQASGLYQWFAQSMNDALPPPTDVKAEMAKLGPNAQAVIDDMVGRADQLKRYGVFNDEDIAEYNIAVGTAEGMKMMQKLFAHFGEKVIPANIAPPNTGLPTHEELRAMKFALVEAGPNKGQERYAVDPEYRKKIDALYDQVYGNQPAGQSVVRAA